MSVEIVIKTLLEASSPVTNLVVARIYLDTRPEADALPAVVYELISNRQDNSHTTDLSKELWTARFQISSLDRTADSTAVLREAVLNACHRASGSIGGIQVTAVVSDGMNGDSYDQLVDIYMKPIDFIVHYLR